MLSYIICNTTYVLQFKKNGGEIGRGQHKRFVF
nr:MAG TPA: hypothetical protein [Caudoviricetes sp.]